MADPAWNEYLTATRASLQIIAGQSGGFAIFDGVVVTITLATTALVACCLPALKAAEVDPAIALRRE